VSHIAISYRRADSDAMAGRIKDELARHFGETSVFIDIDSIPFGTDFREHIRKTLAGNDILVAVIGPKWLGPKEAGQFRIAEENDPVRMELETALNGGRTVIPVLVGGAEMPKASDLPDTLKDFSYRNAAQVDAGRDFHPHMDRLIRAMDALLAEKSQLRLGEPKAGSTAPKAAAPAAATTAQSAVASDAAGIGARTAPAGRHWGLWLVPLLGCMILGLGIGTWIYVRNQQQTAPAPTVAPAPAPTPTPAPTPAPAPAPSIREPEPAIRLPGVISAGCKLGGAPPFFADDFQTVDPAWLAPFSDKTMAYYANGQLALNAHEGKYAHALYWPLRFKNVAVCSTLSSPAQLSSPDGGGAGGVVFWAENTSNFYGAFVSANGSYWVSRRLDGSWATVKLRTALDGIRSGANVRNEIGVTTSDNTATIYINGAKAHEFRGQPPANPSVVGLYAQSSPGERSEWRVHDIAIADLDQTGHQVAAEPVPMAGTGCKPLRAAAFADDFKSPDPGWAVRSGGPISFADGALILAPAARSNYRQLYSSLVFRSASVCTLIKSPSQLPSNLIYGGLAFWAASTVNHYTAAVYPDGRFSVSRYFNREWATILPSTRSEHVRTGPDAVNEMMIAFNGDVAATYLNGQKVFVFRGQPPQKGGSVGVWAYSDMQVSEWRYLDFVVVENK
jgi:hypothetical protein